MNTKRCRNCKRIIKVDKIRCSGCHEAYLEGCKAGEETVKSKIKETIRFIEAD